MCVKSRIFFLNCMMIIFSTWFYLLFSTLSASEEIIEVLTWKSKYLFNCFEKRFDSVLV